MTTISNNKLPEWRKALNSAVENYQSAQSWYEENRDSPSAEQDMDAAEGEIEKLLKQYGVLTVLSLMDEIDELQELRRSCLALRGEIEDLQEQLYEAENRNNADDEELQERRKADSAPPAQIVSIPDDWQTCEKLSDDNCVDNALRELVEDTTGDNGVRVVQAVIRALRDSGLIRTYPDLSQPVDPQISEYEKIMGQAGNSPVTPDGYTLVPVEPTDEMIAAAMNCEDVLFNSDESFCVQYREIYCAMVDTAPALNKGEY